MSFRLADAVHAVDIVDDIVFLDAAADGYLCLVGGRAVITLADGAVEIADEATAQALLAAGLVRRRRTLPDKPTKDLTLVASRPGLRELSALTSACLTTASAFRFKLFRRLLADARSGRGARSPADLDAVLAASAVFSRMRPWSPIGGACLMRSHLQLKYLHHLGLDADWVIGVRTWPFMAHCWLQAGEVALDDDVERLVPYTPILVV